MNIASYMRPEWVCFLEEPTRNKALWILVEATVKTGTVLDGKGFYQAILDREKLMSTGVGMGVALPHAKGKNFKDFFIVVGIQKDNGLSWNSLDGTLVRLIFLVGGPEDNQEKYLSLLSELTRQIREETLRKKLLKAVSAQEVVSLFSSP